MNLRRQAYRTLQSKLVRPWVEARRAPQTPFDLRATSAGRRRVWLHAASAGELESLWSVALAASDRSCELIVTAFSESARAPLARLSRELSGDVLLHTGPSPWEGGWPAALDRARPSIFVTAKYEAWPDLWMSLAEREIPLAIVGARARRSLRLGKWLCTAMGARLPEMRLLAAGPEDAAGLAALFPEARVSVTGEPRWDRVLERSSKGNPRARELVARLRSLPRPWGVLGSAWIEDLDAFRGCLGAIPGTLWTVPHKIDDAHVVPLVQRLSAAGWAPFLTSRENEPAGGGRAAPVVDEVGFLSELYSSADWAYVGGGFGAISVHSTIEPAITGIPIACGARGTWKFPETAELASSGQLTIVRSAQELEAWVASLPGRIVPGLRESYRAQALARGGATERVLAELLSEGRGAC